MSVELNPIHAGLSHLGVLGLRALGAAVSIASPVLWGAAAGAVTPLLWRLLARHRKVALKNLIDTGRTPAEAQAIGKASFRSNILVLFESLAMARLVSRKGVQVESRISPEALEATKKLSSGEETLAFAVSGHTGLWEFNGAEMAKLCAPTPVVVSARLVKNPIVTDFLIKLRNSFGITLVEKEEFLRYLLSHARRKEPRLHVFLCDQHFKGGERVPFLGRKACTVAIPAALIRKYRVPVFMGRCVRRSPGNYLNEFRLFDRRPYENMPEKEAVHEITAAISKFIGETIEAAPEQWTWGHRRWRKCCDRVGK
jgi:lauroyl/myristoyl acyltransferase